MGSSVLLKQVSSAENRKSGEAWANQGSSICKHKFHMSAAELHDLTYDPDIFCFFCDLTVNPTLGYQIMKINGEKVMIWNCEVCAFFWKKMWKNMTPIWTAGIPSGIRHRFSTKQPPTSSFINIISRKSVLSHETLFFFIYLFSAVHTGQTHKRGSDGSRTHKLSCFTSSIFHQLWN
jgi:hypothetical protein